jgi:hypothetical protein
MQRDQKQHWIQLLPGQTAITLLSHETFLIKVRLDMHLILQVLPTSAQTKPDFGLLPLLQYYFFQDPLTTRSLAYPADGIYIVQVDILVI